MSDDPLKGVVDRDCKVHAKTNLYIAGSSVFPTAGTGSPTMLIIALALRLADHIKKQLA
jgi:choline dehydrogenase-like flavoprotein